MTTEPEAPRKKQKQSQTVANQQPSIMTNQTKSSSRQAYTCLGSLPVGFEDGSDLEHYNMEEASKCAVVKDATIQLLPEEESLFQLFEDAAIAFEQNTAPFEIEPKPPVEEENSSESSCAASSLSSFQYKNANIREFNLPPPVVPNHKQHNSGSQPFFIDIRIAGGWVRDKIMQQSSHDVDVALDSLSGHQFAIIVQQYLFYKEQLQEQQQEQTEPSEDVDKGNKGKGKKNAKKRPRITVIAANPSQSKHLETATMIIQGIECDFVHLRGGETYTTDSRIPTLKEDATPLDDALRRDFTVNSLFYNLRKKQVEDWTGRGMKDLLEDKLLVTPLDARITFHDDPLRVLRAIRFAVRYDLTLSQEVVDAAMSPEVHESLHCKVSRERVGKELGGMLSGKNAKPAVALELITKLKLAGCVFEFPRLGQGIEVTGKLLGVEYGQSTSSNGTDMDVDMDGDVETAADSGNSSEISEDERAHARELGWLEATELLSFSSSVLSSFDNGNGIDIRVFYLSLFLHPFRYLICTDKKGKECQLPTFVVRDSIKYSNKEINSVTTVLSNVNEMKAILKSFEENASNFSRLEAGLVLRNLKDLWPTAFVVAVIAEIHSISKSDSHTLASDYVEKAAKLMQTIRDHGLDGCWKVRPLLDGKVLLKSLDLPKGPLIGNYLLEQVKWMLLNPDGSKEECEIYLKSVRKRDLDQESATG